jgi:hypothetical protein
MKKVDIPENQIGEWRVEKFEVSKEDAKWFNLRGAISSEGGYIFPGVYTRLTRSGKVVMSDTPSEMRDHVRFVARTSGIVLINGLGLGMVLLNVLERDKVEKVIVNEISEEVIQLVAPFYTDPRVTINHADAYTWKPSNGERFHAIWHDIWDGKCTDHIPKMQKLHRRYSHWREPVCYQSSWGYEELLYRRKKEREQSAWFNR